MRLLEDKPFYRLCAVAILLLLAGCQLFGNRKGINGQQQAEGDSFQPKEVPRHPAARFFQTVTHRGTSFSHDGANNPGDLR